jgi:hypothetical protein
MNQRLREIKKRKRRTCNALRGSDGHRFPARVLLHRLV